MPSSSSSLSARSHWSKVAAATETREITRGRVGRAGTKVLPRGIESRQTSSLGLLLCTTGAGGRAAAVYQWLQTCSITISVLVHAVSTMPGVTASHGAALRLVEGASSVLFALDYLLRLCTCREHRRFAHLRPIEAQLTWAFTPAAALALIACYPVLSDGSASIHDVLVSLPRLLLLFRTSRWRGAVNTARRVVFVNREILYTSLALVSLTILASATLLYVCLHERSMPLLRPRACVVRLTAAAVWLRAAVLCNRYATCAGEERCREENGIIDLPSAT